MKPYYSSAQSLPIPVVDDSLFQWVGRLNEEVQPNQPEVHSRIYFLSCAPELVALLQTTSFDDTKRKMNIESKVGRWQLRLGRLDRVEKDMFERGRLVKGSLAAGVKELSNTKKR